MIDHDVEFEGKTMNLGTLIRTHKDRFVIKPSDRLGGDGVVVGRFAPQDYWNTLVEMALFRKNWLAQEYIPSATYLYQSGEQDYNRFRAVWGVFVFGSHYGGGFLRILPETNDKGVINVHQGAQVTPLLEVTE